MKDKLQNNIELLREELAKIDDAESFAERFQALNTAIDKLQEDADLEQRREANDQLDEIVTNFEIDHPVIHGLLRNVMKSLADIGI
jgi:chromosome segregation ATPase